MYPVRGRVEAGREVRPAGWEPGTWGACCLMVLGCRTVASYRVRCRCTCEGPALSGRIAGHHGVNGAREAGRVSGAGALPWLALPSTHLNFRPPVTHPLCGLFNARRHHLNCKTVLWSGPYCSQAGKELMKCMFAGQVGGWGLVLAWRSTCMGVRTWQAPALHSQQPALLGSSCGQGSGNTRTSSVTHVTRTPTVYPHHTCRACGPIPFVQPQHPAFLPQPTSTKPPTAGQGGD